MMGWRFIPPERNRTAECFEGDLVSVVREQSGVVHLPNNYARTLRVSVSSDNMNLHSTGITSESKQLSHIKRKM